MKRNHPAIILPLLVGVLLMALTGCGGAVTERTPPAKLVTTSEIVRKQETKIKTVEPKLIRMRELVTGLTNENVAETKREMEQIVGKPDPKLPTGLFLDYDQLLEGNENIGKSVAKDVDHTRKVEAENASLKEPERATIRHWGELAALAGFVIIGLYFASGFIPAIGPWIQKGGSLVLYAGCFCVVLGIALMTFSRFLDTFEHIFFWTTIISGGVAFFYALLWAWENRAKFLDMRQTATTIVKSLEPAKVPVVGGTAPMIDLSKVQQPPDVKAFVDSVQASITTTAPAAPPAPN